MYCAHFGLREPPFSITPDTGYCHAHAAFQSARNTLLVALRAGEGFIKVTGEVGTGKTLLCRSLLNELDAPGFVTAYVPNPYLAPLALLRAVADEFGLKVARNEGQHAILKTLYTFLLDAHAQGRRPVVLLDEVQAMPVESLEALRLLSNLETERAKLLQVVLFGQPELDDRLDHPSVRQLRQRITFSARLRPLIAVEVRAYVEHRLRTAGYAGAPLCTTDAIRSLTRASGGVPRLINILAHKALLAAYGAGSHQVCRSHMAAAVADTESVRARPSLWTRLRVWPAPWRPIPSLRFGAGRP